MQRLTCPPETENHIMLFSLPGGFEPNAALRQCVAKLLRDYPTSMANPMKCLNEFKEQNKDKAQSYPDDLEMDYLMFLKKVQKATKENPLDVEFDFP
jgi:hypothetical protein